MYKRQVSSLGQVWDESTGTLAVPSGFSLTGLTNSVDYCAKDFTPVACTNHIDQGSCASPCVWTPDAADSSTGTCSEVETEVAGLEGDNVAAAAPTDACTNFSSSDSCTSPCEWDDVTGCATP